MPGQHRTRSYLIAALLACSGCGNAASDEGMTDKTGQKASPAGDGAAQAGASAFGEAVLAYPDDLQMTMLAYRLTGRRPPLEDWAGDDFDVRRADEFSKPQLLQDETARLAAIHDATEDAGFLQYRLRSQLSQYDSAKGGYYLTAFAPGQQTTYSGREQVSVQLENMSEAFFWPMDAQQAQDMLALTNRNVTIDVKVRITGTSRRSSGIVITGRITDYGLYSEGYNDERLLGRFSLE